MPLIRDDFVQIGRGLLMGGADIIPGVSGGTVALLLGIYERLVGAISRVDATFFQFLRKRSWSAAAEYVDLRFLVTLACGILLGILALAGVMHELLAHYRAYTLAAFFGLILASSVVVGRMAKPRDDREKLIAIGLAVLGALLALWLVSQRALEPRPGWAYTFGSGAIAISAMILPGISGAYILLLLGKYAEITGIIKNLSKFNISGEELVTLAVFAAGCVLGLVLFSKLLRWLLDRWHAPTLGALCGFMLGSLYKIWPFQTDATPELTEWKYKIFTPYWPESYDRQAMICTAIAVTAAVIVLTLEWFAKRSGSRAKR